MKHDDSRPNPDELLARVAAEEKQQTHGKLTLFLGYAAGVGKTYAMLEAARQLRSEVDLVVALVETHGRTETEALLQGLEVIPRKLIEYRGVTLSEMDLDAVLKRKPQLALVDELAHTNAAGSRHAKRYEDIEELLEAGIDVYTTLNVQHIESLRNVVAQVTGVWVRETVPDTIVEKASEIKLIDLPPDDLLKRLKEGKVYLPDRIDSAIADFFRKGNLSALREMTMRTAAERVDEQMRGYMETHAIRGPWPTAERLLVCVSPGTLGTRLVRHTRRLAYQLGGEWFAVYVETSSARLSAEEQERLTGALKLAEQMKAKVVTLHGDSVADTVAEYARKNHITKIVVGKSQRPLWKTLLRSSVTDRLVRHSDGFDVYVVSGPGEPVKTTESAPSRSPNRWRSHLLGIGLVVAATLIGELLGSVFTPTNLVMLYILAVVIAAVYLAPGTSIMVAIIGTLAFDFFFVPPVLTFTTADVQYTFILITMLGVGVVVSYLTTRFRQQAENARRREQQTSALYELGRDLALANHLNSYVHAIVTRTKETFGHDSIIFLPPTGSTETLKPYSENPALIIDEYELAAAIWSFQRQAVVGHGTDTLPSAKARYLPLLTARGAVGVLALWLDDAPRELTIEEERLLESYASLAAVAIEGIQLGEEAHNAQVLRETEKLQSALLNSVSHDLRTPLVSIMGALSSLQEEGMALDDEARQKMVQVAREEADRLNRLITNLLDVSRIEAGGLTTTCQPTEVQDMVGAALEQLGTRTASHLVKTNISRDLPFVWVDSALIVQTLVNILDNAVKYSPPGSPIEISARQVAQEVEVEVADRGMGIPAEELERVFDKFYRIQKPDSVTGTGLGLSICKGIIEAHGGRIQAENRPGSGTVIRFTLSIPEVGGETGKVL